MIDPVKNIIDLHEYLAANYPAPADLPPPVQVQKWLLVLTEDWIDPEKEPRGTEFGFTESLTCRRSWRNKKLIEYYLEYWQELPGTELEKAESIRLEVKKIREANSYPNRPVNHILKYIDSIFKLPDSRRGIHNILIGKFVS